MSNIPPQPGGWIDGSGNLQQGSPPPGFWQASDGRWYPPDLASSSTQAVAPSSPYGPPSGPPPGGGYPGQHHGPPGGYNPQGLGYQQHGPPGYSPPPSVSGGGSKTGLFVALGVVAAVLILGLAAVVILNSSDDEDPTGDTVAGSDTSGATTDSSVDGGGGTAEGSTTAPAGGDGEITATCSIIDPETAQIDLTNTSSEISNFSLTLVFRDDANNRVGDETGYISSLRPGERTMEALYLYDEAGSVCEVASIDRTAVDPEGAALAADATCTVVGEDALGFVDADISVTNTGSAQGDFSVEAVFLDADGVRRGSGYTSVEAVNPGESAPSDLFSAIDYQDGYTCEVVYVDVYES